MRSFKFTIRGNNYEVEVLKLESTLAEIEVNGTTYQVEIERKKTESKTPILVRSAVPSNVLKSDVKMSAGDKAELSKVIAPLPGTILQIFVKPGDKVKRGDKLLVYEAMKMENNLLAEKDGIIKVIKVNVSDNILQGDLLIEME
ncbi:MAG: biotin/lipoyl-containing protein [Bacteroidales bacterium]|jgi:biotin carboxyl carrier protein|nr:biotin/lipoyl-binding protein [Bacteroidales bacterium]MCK9447985.1 biotin/lipoyl-binding protein [Bacteroidales bacterium]MDD3701048.1 biotin/lipoyl-binding protein [Bacteroidales bacterium]